MIILGLAGTAGSGKDTVADYLVRAYGFVKHSFSDALYSEVQHAFGLPDQSLLRDRETKEVPSELLTADLCADIGFTDWLVSQDSFDGDAPWSPRQILQWWGTEYRRAQNPNYWLDRAEDFVTGLRALYQYPEQAPQHFVNCSVRFENEREWIHTGAHGGLWTGNVWHLAREGAGIAGGHVSEEPLVVMPHERELFNNDSIERLHHGIDLLLTTQAKFVRVEPMAPVAEPLPGGQYYKLQPDGHRMLCNADGTRSIFDDVDE